MWMFHCAWWIAGTTLVLHLIATLPGMDDSDTRAYMKAFWKTIFTGH